jgi:nucleoid-associated protein YgaU
VLACCGVALTATAAPALADPGAGAQQALPPAVSGLPFPERASDLPALTRHEVVVRAGDSLWAIAERHLSAADSPADSPAGAPTGAPTDAEITGAWHELYAHNRAVVGDDPSLIHPGQRLVLPDDLEELS